MKQSIEEWFGPMSDMLNFSQQFAKGAETIGRINAKDIEVGTSEKSLLPNLTRLNSITTKN